MIDNLYNLALALLGGCIVTVFVSIFYIVGMIRYEKKEADIIEALEKIKIRDMKKKENI